MDQDTEWLPDERRIVTTLQEAAGGVTADCLDLTALLGLAQEGYAYPEAARLVAHLARCPFCARGYRQVVKSCRTAAIVRDLQARAVRVFGSGSASVPGVGVPEPSCPFDFRQLAAATAEPGLLFEGIFGEGSLRATVWRAEGLVLLTAENDPRGLWVRDDDDQPTWQPGGGLILAGSLVYYAVSGTQPVEGYLVLPVAPQPDNVVCAEVALGNERDLTEGELTCRLVSPSELTDGELVEQSIARCQDQGSRDAWATLLAREGSRLPPGTARVIEIALAAELSDTEPEGWS